jgi:hypothetical protein
VQGNSRNCSPSTVQLPPRRVSSPGVLQIGTQCSPGIWDGRSSAAQLLAAQEQLHVVQEQLRSERLHVKDLEAAIHSTKENKPVTNTSAVSQLACSTPGLQQSFRAAEEATPQLCKEQDGGDHPQEADTHSGKRSLSHHEMVERFRGDSVRDAAEAELLEQLQAAELAAQGYTAAGTEREQLLGLVSRIAVLLRQGEHVDGTYEVSDWTSAKLAGVEDSEPRRLEARQDRVLEHQTNVRCSSDNAANVAALQQALESARTALARCENAAASEREANHELKVQLAETEARLQGLAEVQAVTAAELSEALAERDAVMAASNTALVSHTTDADADSNVIAAAQHQAEMLRVEVEAMKHQRDAALNAKTFLQQDVSNLQRQLRDMGKSGVQMMLRAVKEEVDGVNELRVYGPPSPVSVSCSTTRACAQPPASCLDVMGASGRASGCRAAEEEAARYRELHRQLQQQVVRLRAESSAAGAAAAAPQDAAGELDRQRRRAGELEAAVAEAARREMLLREDVATLTARTTLLQRDVERAEAARRAAEEAACEPHALRAALADCRAERDAAAARAAQLQVQLEHEASTGCALRAESWCAACDLPSLPLLRRRPHVAAPPRRRAC